MFFLEIIGCYLVWTATLKCPHTLSDLSNENVPPKLCYAEVKIQSVVGVCQGLLLISKGLSSHCVLMLLSHMYVHRRTGRQTDTVGVFLPKRASILSEKHSTLIIPFTVPFQEP